MDDDEQLAEPARCDYCGRRWDRPSQGCKNDARHRRPDMAEAIVDLVEDFFDDRKGLSWRQLDTEVLEELRDDLALELWQHFQAVAEAAAKALRAINSVEADDADI